MPAFSLTGTNRRVSASTTEDESYCNALGSMPLLRVGYWSAMFSGVGCRDPPQTPQSFASLHAIWTTRHFEQIFSTSTGSPPLPFTARLELHIVGLARLASVRIRIGRLLFKPFEEASSVRSGGIDELVVEAEF